MLIKAIPKMIVKITIGNISPLIIELKTFVGKMFVIRLGTVFLELSTRSTLTS
jgi:hypothetical protein